MMSNVTPFGLLWHFIRVMSYVTPSGLLKNATTPGISKDNILRTLKLVHMRVCQA